MQGAGKDMLFGNAGPDFPRAHRRMDARYMLIDTVGLVSRLPHQLVQALSFHLEEAVDAGFDSQRAMFRRQSLISSWK